MILETKEYKEFHPNGQAWIVGKIGVIAPMWKHLYDYRTNEMGQVWCRLGKWTKQYDNAQLAWTLEYDEYGYGKGNDHPQFRKDGTAINQR